MGVDVIGYVPPSFVMYGASSAVGASVAFSSTTDSAASLSIPTTATNTKWLIEIDADIDTAGNGTFLTGLYLKAKVDGGYVFTTGTRYGSGERELTIRGRVVVTLATVATHTILAAVNNVSTDSRGGVTLNSIAITATQLTG